MQLTTAIFDMDGLLIDSEPLWNEAANEVFEIYGVRLTDAQHIASTGLRTKEFVQTWFKYHRIDESECACAENKIFDRVLELIKQGCAMLPGVQQVIEFFHQRNFKIGIASSSPLNLIEFVAESYGLKKYLQGMSSAEYLDYGKPHPQVYLNCAGALGSDPAECICFEDSFNGMIAVKAARMKCVVVPHRSQLKEERWSAADLKLSSLQNFGQLHLNLLQ